MTDLQELRRALTERQARFAEEYVRLAGNATEAARQAGYSGGDSALGRQGHENRRKPKIVAYIDALFEEVRPTVKHDVEAVIERLYEIALAEGEQRHSQVRAAEVLLKVAGKLDPRVRVELETSLSGQLEQLRQRMPDEAFRALIEALGQQDSHG